MIWIKDLTRITLLPRGGPYSWLSLAEARRNFHAVGACDERCTQSVRASLPRAPDRLTSPTDINVAIRRRILTSLAGLGIAQQPWSQAAHTAHRSNS
ncbi:CPCC family cysteine-rich protein [Streptomyces sp. NPDC007264]|uniref:CPCC family cysteine-rich protein n=1 Tax=Streptomyces sp. NPDC007264 TaxID=3364777 RepID=UPI0036DD3DFA